MFTERFRNKISLELFESVSVNRWCVDAIGVPRFHRFDLKDFVEEFLKLVVAAPVEIVGTIPDALTDDHPEVLREEVSFLGKLPDDLAALIEVDKGPPEVHLEDGTHEGFGKLVGVQGNVVGLGELLLEDF